MAYSGLDKTLETKAGGARTSPTASAKGKAPPGSSALEALISRSATLAGVKLKGNWRADLESSELPHQFLGSFKGGASS